MIIAILFGTAVVYYLFRNLGGGSLGGVTASAINKPSAQTQKSVKLFAVERSSFSENIEGLMGTVKGETLELSFGSQEEKIKAIRVQVGQMVKRGTLLMESDHTRAAARLEQAKINWSRAKALARVGAATSLEAREARSVYKSARKDFEETFIYAPKSGYVSAINKEVGETAGHGDAVIVLVSAESLFYVETGVTEDWIDRVQEGQGAYVSIDALGDKEVQAMVSGISRELTVTGRAASVRLLLPDYLRSRLRPGMSVQCRIRIFHDPEALVVPKEAYSAEAQGVYVENQGIVSLRKVVLGHAKQNYYQVAQGLNEGERIVANIVSHPVATGESIVVEGEAEKYQQN